MTSIRWLGSPTSSAASPTSHRAGFPNCCHGIGNIRTCGWPLELWRPSPTSSRSGVLPRSWAAMKTCYGSCPTSSSPKTGSCGFTLSMALKPPPSPTMASRLFAKLSRIRSIAPVNPKTSVPRCSAYAYVIPTIRAVVGTGWLSEKCASRLPRSSHCFVARSSRLDQEPSAQSGIVAVRALRQDRGLLHGMALPRLSWYRTMRRESEDRSQPPRRPRCRLSCLPGSRTEQDRGQDRTRPARSYPGWACATDDRGGTRRRHGGGDKDSDTLERSLCVPLQSDHTSIVSSLHRRIRRNNHGRCRTGWLRQRSAGAARWSRSGPIRKFQGRTRIGQAGECNHDQH